MSVPVRKRRSRHTQVAGPPAAPGTGRPWRRWGAVAITAGIFLLVFAVFLPTLSNDFVDWDDPGNILKNVEFRGLGTSQLRWMFTTFHMGHYQPLSWITLALDYLWSQAVFGDGLKPLAYHLTNNLLHAANAGLVYLLMLRLLGAAIGPVAAGPARLLRAAAALAALLHAVHPLRVESVAWATERRDVQSSFFLLLTVLCYLRAVQPTQRHRAAWSGITLLLYTCSLLSRALGVTMPLILLLLDWYPLRRFAARGGVRRVLLEKVPLVLLAAVAAVIAPLAQESASATARLEFHGLVARCFQACYGLVFYVWKTIVPVELSPIYELRLPINVLSAHYLVPAALVAGAVLALLVFGRRQSGLLVAAACYAILLAPVSGFVQSGNQETADRYSYLPAVAFGLLVAAGLWRLWTARRAPLWLKAGGAAAASGIVVVLAVLTVRQCSIWRDTATLWEYAARVSPNSSIAQNGFGWVLLDQKRYAEAEPHLRRAIALQPGNEKSQHNLWRLLREQGRDDELLAAYWAAVRLVPGFVDAHYNLGLELQRRQQTDEALAAFRTALQLRPDHSKAHTHVAQLLARRGDTGAALQHYEAAIRADAGNAVARRGLARLLKQQDRTAEAVAQLRAALQSDPHDAATQKLLDEWTASPGGAR